MNASMHRAPWGPSAGWYALGALFLLGLAGLIAFADALVSALGPRGVAFGPRFWVNIALTTGALGSIALGLRRQHPRHASQMPWWWLGWVCGAVLAQLARSSAGSGGRGRMRTRSGVTTVKL